MLLRIISGRSKELATRLPVIDNDPTPERIWPYVSERLTEENIVRLFGIISDFFPRRSTISTFHYKADGEGWTAKTTSTSGEMEDVLCSTQLGQIHIVYLSRDSETNVLGRSNLMISLYDPPLVTVEASRITLNFQKPNRLENHMFLDRDAALEPFPVFK